jgi:hypothetical protein
VAALALEVLSEALEFVSKLFARVHRLHVGFSALVVHRSGVTIAATNTRNLHRGG